MPLPHSMSGTVRYVSLFIQAIEQLFPGAKNRIQVAVSASGPQPFFRVESQTIQGKTSQVTMWVIPVKFRGTQLTIKAIESMDADLITRMIKAIEDFKFPR